LDKKELKNKLSPMAFRVTQEHGTEPAFTGAYVDNHAEGTYRCVVCGQKLFESDTKFDSGTGWPSFDKAIPGSTVTHSDDTYGMNRVEVSCSKCGAHLGHMFDDGPSKTTGERFCINSCALDLKKKEAKQ
jgi:peptide-methionine (R)-S-oxide reductase